MLKIGELARRTGLTVRTIRYYEEKGLLIPLERSRSGYRLYGVKELERLHSIRSLKQLGLHLDEIKTYLEGKESNLKEIISRQMIQVRTEIEIGKQLYDRLKRIAGYIESQESPSVNELIETLNTMTMYEKYYSKEQLGYLEKRKEEVGEDRILEVQQEWQDIIQQMRIAMEKGTDPASEEVQKLIKRSGKLIQEFTGGNPGIRKSLENMYKNEGAETVSQGFMDQEVMAYMNQARKVSLNQK